MNLNQVNLIGRITRDPELKTLPNGTPLVNFTVVTNHTYKSKDGNRVENATYHNCKTFGRMAETIAKYMKKGSMIFVQGRIDNRSWDKEDGTKGYMTEIMVEDFQLGPSAKPKTAEDPEGQTLEQINDSQLDNMPF